MQINHGFVCNVPKTFPFTNIKNYKLSLTVSCSDLQFSYDNNLNSTDSCLVLNSPENLTNLFFFFFFSINVIVQHRKLKSHNHQAPI